MYLKEIKNRDLRFDILKVIGIFCIILAHFETGKIVFQLRNFVVPLMVICSGALYYHSLQRSNLTFFEYIKKRVARLLAPSWMFLFLYFLLIFIICFMTKDNYPYSWSDILKEFVLRSRIIGLWIIRVFILVSFTALFLYKIYLYFENKLQFLFLLCLIYLLYELSYKMLSVYDSSIIFKLLKKTVFELIPYGCLFGLGMSISSLKQKTVFLLSLLFFIIFSILFLIKSSYVYPVSTQLYKYPPRLYYLSYAIFATLFLYIFFSNIKIGNNKIKNIIIFLSSSSLWIYLWHWFFLRYSISIAQNWFLLPPEIINNCVINYLLVVILSILITFLQKISINYVINRIPMGKRTEKFLSITFLH